MGLLKTALIGGVAYKLGSRKNDDKPCTQCSSCNHSASNWSPPQQSNYYQPGYQPQYTHGQPPYASQSRSPYDTPGNGYQSQANYSANDYAPQTSRGIQEPHMTSAKSSQNPPPYQPNPAYQSYQNQEKSPAFAPNQGYQQTRYN